MPLSRSTTKANCHPIHFGRLLLVVITIDLFVPFPANADDKSPQFSRDVRPILSRTCFVCHGPDEASREAELRLDQRESAVKQGVIDLEDLDQSELIKRIFSNDSDSVMPPPDSGHQLTAQEKKILKDWVMSGANYQQHWSFVVPKPVPVTTFEENSWSNQPIDQFVLKRLREAGLSPNPAEEKLRLLRRVSLDLTGLPPTLEEANRFAEDASADAYEKVVDRLLQSESFGEHWAQLWLDLARYADTKGYEKDRHRNIWRYRDWLIKSINDDLPFDQFTIDQLAGDLLPQPKPDQILATAFHRNTMENDEGGTDDEEFRVAAVKDRVDTTMQIWMGLTMGCAKCHSHKYDPISQHDYYAFYDFFNQTEDADRGAPTIPTPTVNQKEQLEKLESELRELSKKASQKTPEFEQALEKWKAQFQDRPLWRPMSLSEFESRSDLELNQDSESAFEVAGELPEKDSWTIKLELPAGENWTSFRILTFPKPKGGKWPDKNVALRDLKVWIQVPGQDLKLLKLTNPRADFSQRGWEVAKAINGNVDAGWAFSPKANEGHVAIFDFAEPIRVSKKSKLIVKLEQEYGQGLTLKKFRLDVSTYPTQWLKPELQPEKNLAQVFRSSVFEPTRQIAAEIKSRQTAINSLRRQIPTTPIMKELPYAKKRITKIHNRGNFLDQGEKVQGRVPAAFGSLPKDMPRNRLTVAQWLVHEDNPLTARVAVNRIWSRLFGVGIVETEEDFGTQGALPTHPELLDWLAIEFRKNGWSRKRLLKTIVLSETYRQSASVSAEKISKDPRNRLFSRGPRFRLSAETVRDQALLVSGLLTRSVGGPSVMPPQPGGIWKSTYSGEKWKNANGPDRFRRALYTYRKRTSPYPAMTTFDSGSGEVCLVRRIRTNTPLQALVTLNDVPFIEAAGALAKRMKDSADGKRQQIANGFRMVLIRAASKPELDRLVQLYDELQDEIDDELLLKSANVASVEPRLIAIANVLLNLDETLMKP